MPTPTPDAPPPATGAELAAGASDSFTLDDMPVIHVVCGTFNVGNAPIDDLGGWIAARGELGPDVFADVVALGMQESTWGAAKAKQEQKKGADADSESEDDDDADAGGGSSRRAVDVGPDAAAAGDAARPRVPVLECSAPAMKAALAAHLGPCLLYTSPSPRDATLSRMPSSA